MQTTTTTKPSKKHVQLTVVFKPEELQRLENLAQQEIRSKSSMARLLVNEALESRENNSA
ncbi:MAG: ribbon-helix-helix domain-containing protein [Nitrincola lacisaponensis]|uniref:ribbon-helix-helix domain-containing protein n=1 Tax=Nitrincola lacisaponensis TaxID=267850 RepID=UPI00391DE4A1